MLHKPVFSKRFLSTDHNAQEAIENYPRLIRSSPVGSRNDEE